MVETFVGHIVPVAFSRVPRGWAPCDGRLLPIAQHSYLYSVIGTTYGGDGQTSFALPDLRGRAPIGMGQGPGLTQRQLGERLGQEKVTLSVAQLPSHTHALKATTSPGDQQARRDVAPAASPPGGGEHYGRGEMRLTAVSTGGSGGGQAHENRQPFLAIQYLICLEGWIPSPAP